MGRPTKTRGRNQGATEREGRIKKKNGNLRNALFHTVPYRLLKLGLGNVTGEVRPTTFSPTTSVYSPVPPAPLRTESSPVTGDCDNENGSEGHQGDAGFSPYEETGPTIATEA